MCSFPQADAALEQAGRSLKLKQTRRAHARYGREGEDESRGAEGECECEGKVRVRVRVRMRVKMVAAT